MADLRDDCGPYWRVQAVVGWAHRLASILVGHLLTKGIDIDQLDDGVAWYCIVYVALLDHHATRAEITARFDELHEWGTTARPDRLAWGEAETTRAGAQAMLDLVRGHAAQAQPTEG